MRRLLVLLLVLGALFAGVDRIALLIAERAVAAQARTAGGLASDPTVSITGFPFLTQAFRGSYDDVEVTASDLKRGGVRLLSLRADLRDVQVSLQDALGGKVSAVPVRAISATAVLGYADLTAAHGRGFTIAPTTDGLLRVTGRLTVLGQTMQASAVSSVRLDGRTIVVTARRLEVGGRAVSVPVAAALGNRLDLRVPITGLPYGLELTAVSATADGLVLTARAGPTILR